MDVRRSSSDLLAHFDGPIHGETAEQEATSLLQFRPRSSVAARGIGWVLKWAAALAVLTFAASMLIEFAFVVAAEHAMVRAARAGALEATMPRATYKSVLETIERRLANYPSLPGRLRLSVEQNGSPIRNNFQPQDGDRISLTLSADSSAVLPSWLQRLPFRQTEPAIEVRAERQIPGRQLANARTR